MIRISVSRANGAMTITAEGHDESRVCSAISAIMETAALGLAVVAGHHPDAVEITLDDETASSLPTR